MNDTEFSVASLRRQLIADKDAVLAKLDSHGNLFDAVIKAMPTGVIVRMNADTIGVDISTTGDKHELAAIIRAYRINGFTTDSKPPAKNDPSWSAWFRQKNGATSVLCFTSKVCRRIKTGTKMVEQEVFETVCDEMILPELSVVA